MIPSSPNSLLDPIQLYIGMFLYLLLGLALSNFIFAKIPYTRGLIDFYLGDTFISDHEINMRGIQLLKVGGVVGATIMVKNGDDWMTAQNNARILIESHNAMNKVGLQMSPEHAERILNRPSFSQQTVAATLEKLKAK